MAQFAVYFDRSPDGETPGIWRVRRQPQGGLVNVRVEGIKSPERTQETAIRFLASLFVDPKQDPTSLEETRQRIIDNCLTDAPDLLYTREIVADLAELDQHGEVVVGGLLADRGINMADYVDFRDAVLGALTLGGAASDI